MSNGMSPDPAGAPRTLIGRHVITVGRASPMSRTLGEVTNRTATCPSPVRGAAALFAGLALGVALLAGCSSEGASTDCGLDQCTVTFDRGVEGKCQHPRRGGQVRRRRRRPGHRRGGRRAALADHRPAGRRGRRPARSPSTASPTTQVFASSIGLDGSPGRTFENADGSGHIEPPCHPSSVRRATASRAANSPRARAPRPSRLHRLRDRPPAVRLVGAADRVRQARPTRATSPARCGRSPSSRWASSWSSRSAIGLVAMAIWQLLRGAHRPHRRAGQGAGIRTDRLGRPHDRLRLLRRTPPSRSSRATPRLDRRQPAEDDRRPAGQHRRPLAVGLAGLAVAALGIGLVIYGVMKKFERHLKTGADVAVDPQALPPAGHGRLLRQGRGVRHRRPAVRRRRRQLRPGEGPWPGRGARTRCATSRTAPILLTLIALGIAAFGVFCFVQSKYRKV